MTETQSKHLKNRAIALKTAAIVVGMNIFLTGFKFIVYVFSDSLAVLAEAWHSFTDIATSGMVFFALEFTNRRNRKFSESGERETPPTVGKPEMIVSICIGVLLLTVACFLFKKLMGSELIPVRNPLASGIIFLVFAILSYFVGTFETRVGKREASLGLISDGMHAKADMIASLLTGFSLIVYSMGLNIDKWIAGIIAVFILALALEIFANVYRVHRDKNGDLLYTYRFFNSVPYVFSIKNMKQIPRQFHTFLANRLGDGKKTTLLHRSVLLAPLIGMALFYGSTACYTVAANETAIVERFGRPVSKETPVPPGFHLKLPWPFDKVIKVPSSTIHELNIGNISTTDNRGFIWTLKHGTEEAFLTGDNNFFYPYIILHYLIRDPFKYLYKNSDPEKLLSEIGHRIAVILFARESFYDIATTDRELLQKEMTRGIQECLDKHQSGIQLVNVNFKDIHPPISIARSFENVIAGFQEKQELINKAIGYANGVIPDSRGKGEKNIQAAAGDTVFRIRVAEGEAKRFNLRLPATDSEKEITMTRIYCETMKETLKHLTKIIVDPQVGTPEIWMNFENPYFE